MKKDREISAFLARDTEFEGELTFDGTIRIDGHFKGKILSPTGSLILGEQSKIEGDMYISYVIVSGEVSGNILAYQKIEIRSSGRVFGNIQTPILGIQEGAIFEGEARMSREKETEEKRVPVVESEDTSPEPSPGLGTIHGVITAEPPRPEGSIHDIVAAREENRVGDPIRNATVFAVCKGVRKRKTKTDGSGYYELTDLEDGAWTLKVKARGYEKVESTVIISDGGVYEENFE